jgi:hypothetical protein
MITIQNKNYFTVEEIAAKSGYKLATIYNFTSEGILSPPILNLSDLLYQSKGLYKECVFDELNSYIELKLKGMKKRDIIHLIKSNRARAIADESLLPILEARG